MINKTLLLLIKQHQRDPEEAQHAHHKTVSVFK